MTKKEKRNIFERKIYSFKSNKSVKVRKEKNWKRLKKIEKKRKRREEKRMKIYIKFQHEEREREKERNRKKNCDIGCCLQSIDVSDKELFVWLVICVTQALSQDLKLNLMTVLCV